VKNKNQLKRQARKLLYKLKHVGSEINMDKTEKMLFKDKCLIFRKINIWISKNIVSEDYSSSNT